MAKERLTALRKHTEMDPGHILKFQETTTPFNIIRGHVLAVISEDFPVANILVSRATKYTQSVCTALVWNTRI